VINLRYHIVSIVAVFLALGIGVVMGSTVIDRVTVDTLNARVNSVERSVRAADAENRRINGQLQTVRDFADQARTRSPAAISRTSRSSSSRYRGSIESRSTLYARRS
jgi:hypothetical protein